MADFSWNMLYKGKILDVRGHSRLTGLLTTIATHKQGLTGAYFCVGNKQHCYKVNANCRSITFAPVVVRLTLLIQRASDKIEGMTESQVYRQDSSHLHFSFVRNKTDRRIPWAEGQTSIKLLLLLLFNCNWAYAPVAVLQKLDVHTRNGHNSKETKHTTHEKAARTSHENTVYLTKFHSTAQVQRTEYKVQ
jgi:hypothetical protein